MFTAWSVKQRLKQILIKKCNHFLRANVGESSLCLIEVEILAEKCVHIIRIAEEYKQNDDEHFYAECLHKFVSEYALHNLPLYLALDNDLLLAKEFTFPKMSPKELSEAIKWEINNFTADYAYGCVANLSAENYVVDVIFCTNTFYDIWQKIATKEHLSLLIMTNLSNNEITDEIREFSFSFDEEYLPQKLSLNEIKYNLSLIVAHKPLANLVKTLPSTLNWRCIYALVGAVLLALSMGIGSYMYSNYYVLANEHQRLAQQNDLLQTDKLLIEDIQAQEASLTQKRAFIKEVYAHSSMFYPLLVALGSNINQEIQLTAVNVENNHIVIEGKALNYAALTAYKQQLSSIKFITNIEITSSKLSEQDNLIEFSLNMNEVQ